MPIFITPEFQHDGVYMRLFQMSNLIVIFFPHAVDHMLWMLQVTWDALIPVAPFTNMD